jgi:APA family basic amino acid/polyamine antiporter
MSTSQTDEGLKRVIGVSGLSLSIVNFTIGAGIFVLPAIVSINMGAFGILAYLFCGMLMSCVMLCYSEIGSRVTKSGGTYAYVETAFGPFAGYISNWLYFFAVAILGDAALMNIVADSLAAVFPIFTGVAARTALFFLLIGFMIITNVRGTKQGIGFVKCITIIKLLPLFAIIIFGFTHVKATNLHFENLPSANTFANTTLILFFAFVGFETALGASGEIKNPKRTVPYSILIGGLLLLLIYTMLQIVTQGVLGPEVASVKDAPLAAVAEKIIGPVGATILLITAGVSCFGNVSADVLATPRLLFAGANDGLFPKFLGKVHSKYATPYIAVIIYGTLIFIFSISAGFKQLAILSIASSLVIYMSVILSTVKLRTQKQKVSGKKFRVPGGLTIPTIGIVAIIWLLTSLSKFEIISVAVFISLVAVLYFITKGFKKRNILPV